MIYFSGRAAVRTGGGIVVQRRTDQPARVTRHGMRVTLPSVCVCKHVPTSFGSGHSNIRAGAAFPEYIHLEGLNKAVIHT